MKKTLGLFFSLILICAVSPAFAAKHYTSIIHPDSPIYFGFISYAEIQNDGNDPVVIRKSTGIRDVAEINTPIAPGDIIRTSSLRRCEIQFDTGTIVRLDHDTELEVETILARSLSSRNLMSTLILRRGRIYLMYRSYDGTELFQVLTTHSAVKLSDRAVLSVGVNPEKTSIDMFKGRAVLLSGNDPERLITRTLKASGDVQLPREESVLGYGPVTDFYRWNQTINENFKALHEGVTALPKPVQKYPKAVFEFAQKYGNTYGEWQWNSIYGYVWRPHYNDSSPWGTWRPYFYGHWRMISSDLFWVPEEDWGWVPYHLGLWIWDKDSGWIWLPGSAFAPAWVSWNFFMGQCSWRPWSLFDWLSYDRFVFGSNFYNYWSGMFPATYAGGEAYHFYGWDRYGFPSDPGSNQKPILTKINKSQLKNAKNAPYSLPKEMTGLLKTFAAALNRNNSGLLAALGNIPAQSVIVPLEHLHSAHINKQALSIRDLDRTVQKGFFSPQNKVNPSRQAVHTFKSGAMRDMPLLQIRIPIDALNRIAQEWDAVPAGRENFDRKNQEGNSGRSKPGRSISDGSPVENAQSSLFRPVSRIRDWNPDARIAFRAGLTITSSGDRNEISCPALNLSSSRVTRSSNLVTMTGITSELSGVRSYGSRGSASASAGNQGNSSGMGSQSSSTGSRSQSSSAGTSSRSASAGSSSKGGSSGSGATKK